MGIISIFSKDEYHLSDVRVIKTAKRQSNGSLFLFECDGFQVGGSGLVVVVSIAW